MALRLEDKKALVAEVNATAAVALSAVAAEYSGLTVSQMTEFRAKARAQGVYIKVVKNTLAKRAIEGTEFECLKDVLKVYPAADLERLASLPTLDQARAILLGVFQAPATQLVRTLAEPSAMLVRTLAAYGEKKAA